MLVDAPQVAAPQGDAVPVEKFKDVNGDFAPAARAIAKLCGAELPFMLGCQIADDLDDLGQRRAEEEVILRNLMHRADAPGKLQKFADFRFRPAKLAGNVAHSWGVESHRAGYQRLDLTP